MFDRYHQQLTAAILVKYDDELKDQTYRFVKVEMH